jgi:hypothetical protein
MSSYTMIMEKHWPVYKSVLVFIFLNISMFSKTFFLCNPPKSTL